MINPLPTWPLAIEFQQPEVSFVTPQILMRKAAAVVGKPIVESIDDEDKFEEQDHEQNEIAASLTD
jgi:hypothetical protein